MGGFAIRVEADGFALLRRIACTFGVKLKDMGFLRSKERVLEPYLMKQAELREAQERWATQGSRTEGVSLQRRGLWAGPLCQQPLGAQQDGPCMARPLLCQ
jgi:hypothetical protein